MRAWIVRARLALFAVKTITKGGGGSGLVLY